MNRFVACLVLLIAATPVAGQVVTELREVRADGTPGSVIDHSELTLRPRIQWMWLTGKESAGTTRARFQVDEHGRVQRVLAYEGELTITSGLHRVLSLSEAIEAWTFPPGEARQLAATIELARPGAPFASESGSKEGLLRWLRRIEHWEPAEPTPDSCEPCRAWAAFERESRTVAASTEDAAELFGSVTSSPNPIVAAIARWRVAEAEGRPDEDVLRAGARSDPACVGYMAARRYLRDPRLTRGASVSDMDELSAALDRAGAGARAMRPTTILGDLAVSSIGNGSDHIFGRAFFERVDSGWKLLCRGADSVDG